MPLLAFDHLGQGRLDMGDGCNCEKKYINAVLNAY